ncbi:MULTISPECIES: chemotaxis protein [Sulfurimonas]|uniref:chemotaxis protein n=1 Tax=Sulfurimonas TaxID=202746 RepID=UPI00125F7A76|nr:chemotaxis protein [Sulfurimonas hydrogeniphila]
MTQEELDALMSGGVDMDDMSEEDEHTQDDENSQDKEDESSKDPITAGIEAAELPLPATNENKMVHQLDDVTKESEEKASEIFDIIDNISSNLMEKEESLNIVSEILHSNIELFTKLCEKFPDVQTFQTQLEKNETALNEINGVIEVLQESGDAIMSVMDIMQYQDIHRQKIERVINVMRALSKYMNTLFEGKIDDDKRVSSAIHIAGDTHNELASTDDIEALLEQFSKQ